MTHLLVPHAVCNRDRSLVSRLIGGPEIVRAVECTQRFNTKIGHSLFHSLFQRDEIVGRSLYQTLPTNIGQTINFSKLSGNASLEFRRSMPLINCQATVTFTFDMELLVNCSFHMPLSCRNVQVYTLRMTFPSCEWIA